MIPTWDEIKYAPNTWVVLHIKEPEEHFKVLGGTSGGYLDGDSWNMNSGIVSVIEEDDYLYFEGISGSWYKCYKGGYGLRMSNGGIYNKMKKEFGDIVMLMDEDTNWLEMDWLISPPMSKRIT